VLEVRNLTVREPRGALLLENVGFAVPRQRAIGLTGESGAGKSTLLKAIMGILDSRLRVVSGGIALDGRALENLPPRLRRACCGTMLGFIPQNPMTAFDGRIRIAGQMVETFRLRLGLSGADALALAAESLAAVNLRDVDRVLQSFPAQLSGGMLQRIALALAVGLKPRYILADEPTSALDAGNREMLVELLAGQLESAGILLISHDIDALGALCSEIFVMEKGRITESGPMDKLINRPERSWTRTLAAACQNRRKGGFSWTDL